MENTEVSYPCPPRATASSTFLIKILYTQHNSIQGIVQWIDQEEAVYFRSLLELIILMEDALKKGKKRTDAFRIWDVGVK
ncbi:MAG: hypothetical protein GX376_01380 [Firmicutes bacterium]|nr:hypothetical protein [Bacillota bacterium]